MPDLREIAFGEMEGLTFSEAALRFPDVCAIWAERPAEVAFPGGESFADVRARVRAASDAIVRRHPGGCIAVFGHAGPMRILIADTAGVRSDEAMASGRVGRIAYAAVPPVAVAVARRTSGAPR